MLDSKLDLDVSSPEQIAGVLRNAALAFYENERKVQLHAGACLGSGVPGWAEVAKILMAAVDEIERLGRER